MKKSDRPHFQKLRKVSHSNLNEGKVKIKFGAPYYADRQIDKQKESRELEDTQYWRGGEIGDKSQRDLLGSGTHYWYQIPRKPLVG